MNIIKSSSLALFGYPLTYSLSPQIHKLFANQCGIDLTYKLYAVPAAELLLKIEQFKQQGGIGFNVTSPYKHIMYQQLQNATHAAEIAQAVNTVKILADGSLYGENTDGDGLLLDLQKNRIPLKDQTILILGAGGAVSGILNDLITQQPARIILVNRNSTKARSLQARYQCFAAIDIITYAEIATVYPSVIINAVIQEAIIALWFYLQRINFQDTYCYDLNYNSISSDFMRLALRKGARKSIGGLGMLVAQAASGFNFWHGIYPDLTGILPHLQQYLRKNTINDL